ncbi:hypothetical protein CHS0354_030589 [Potamilus streckersoni]|uniref:MRH domain-containing protein n=1 Tax=Potamilus streckersoni TaxID=2493646 RepID=A0AAE0SCR6_9BIVA|nr:hypothetical protein CHS0354_030589 [Potamilus streckersoni]
MGFTSGTVFLMALSASVYCLPDLPVCTENDYHYEYTECKNDLRWRVSVPTPGKCSGGTPSAPVLAKECSFTCKPGEFLDISKQICVECQAGTYSIGGGARFEEWDKLPDGFTVKTETYSFLGEEDTSKNCSSSEWKPYGNYIGVRPADCGSTLIYAARLVKPGTLTFIYQQTAHQIAYIHFTVQNDQCQATDKEDGKWLSGSEGGKWETVTMDLKSGLNILSWKAISVETDNDNPQAQPVIVIKKIEISGVAFTSECSKCKNGSYSSSGSHSCTPCPINTYSGHGASQCTPCDPATEFSDLGASVCQKKPPCTEKDYYMVQSPCDEKEKTRVFYKWIEPRICRTDVQGAVNLPQDGESSACPPCSPGMHRINRTCEFCPPNHYSDGISGCKQCTVNTSPDYDYNYKSFSTLLPNMTSECVSLQDKDCSNESGWLPFGDHLHSHVGRNENAYVLLHLKIPGFRATSGPLEGMSAVTVGEISFEFETSGSDSCQLLFIVAEGQDIQSIKQQWTGTNRKQRYVYQVTKNSSLSLIWAFQNSAWMYTSKDSQTNLNGVAKIYSIKVTNTLNGGAEKCQTCPEGTTRDGCIPCPEGHYIDPDIMKCMKCPPNTVVYSRSSYGVNSCKPCGPGLIASKGSTCVSECTFRDTQGRNYDFKNLTSFHLIEGGHLFTSKGTQFYRAFNISLCGDPEDVSVSCKDNFTSSMEETSKIESVRSMICKMTMVPAQGQVSAVMTTQSSSIGDHLTKVVWNQTDKNLTDLYTKAGFSTQGIENDIQFHYAADAPTLACPNGRTTILSLRCDMKQEGSGILSTPPKCPDGTCDGCIFHFLWTTQSACPICRQMDFEKVIGECVGGKQIIHYYPPKNCTLKGTNAKMLEEKKCTVELRSLPFMFQIAIPVVLGLALILGVMLFVIWRRNRKLEYRYMKLVESSGGKDGELPGVDSCALEEDEEDDQLDTVKITKGTRFFRNFKKMSGKDLDNPFESMQMKESTPLT